MEDKTRQGIVTAGSEEVARAAFDDHARAVARAAVHHLKIQYPAALRAVPQTAERSLQNHIRQQINVRFKPLLETLVAMDRDWTEDLS